MLAAILLTLALGLTIAQKKQPVKRVELTAQTISKQPKGKPYALDLTRKGTLYNLAADADYSRVQIHTATGEMALADLVEKSGKNGRLVIGLITDLRGIGLKLGSPKVPFKYRCEGLTCKCSGDADCSDMFAAGVCGDVASCDNGNGTCECFKKL